MSCVGDVPPPGADRFDIDIDRLPRVGSRPPHPPRVLAGEEAIDDSGE
jgi:hypothetical protein